MLGLPVVQFEGKCVECTMVRRSWAIGRILTKPFAQWIANDDFRTEIEAFGSKTGPSLLLLTAQYKASGLASFQNLRIDVLLLL